MAWKSLMQLSDHNKIRSERNPDLSEFNRAYIVDFLMENKILSPLRPQQHDRREVEHVAGLMVVNNVNLNLKEGRGTGLYLTFARINHSCSTNTKSIKFQDHRCAREIGSYMDKCTYNYVLSEQAGSEGVQADQGRRGDHEPVRQAAERNLHPTAFSQGWYLHKRLQTGSL